jgi:hypothetical protein
MPFQTSPGMGKCSNPHLTLRPRRTGLVFNKLARLGKDIQTVVTYLNTTAYLLATNLLVPVAGFEPSILGVRVEGYTTKL